MCILFIKLLKAAKPGEFKFILAANRDEFFKRPGKSAHFWLEDGNIIGGRDMTENKQGGTWLAMCKKGKIGVLLNVSGEGNQEKLGRGFLVPDYLKTSLTDREYLEKLREIETQYNKFHLVTAVISPDPKIYHYSNDGDSGITEIGCKTFAISNSSIKSPFQKVVRGKEKFESICDRFGTIDKKEDLVKNLLSFLKWEEKHYPDDVIDSLTHLPQQFKPIYSAVFVRSPDLPYGTRTHTIVLVDWNDKVEFHEWTLKEPILPSHMEWEETHEKFNLNVEESSKL